MSGMTLFAEDAERTHKEWLGYLQPVGLVVVPRSLLNAGAQVDKSLAGSLEIFREALETWPLDAKKDEGEPYIPNWTTFAARVLGWEPHNTLGDPLPPNLTLHLPEYQETLKPTWAVPEPHGEGTMMLIQQLPTGTILDRPMPVEGRQWEATPQERFERLLRAVEPPVPLGLLTNGLEVRVVYAPKGETSGYLTFPVKAMTEPAGRPIFGAFLMLLGNDRLFTLPDEARLPAILADSRRAQAEVSISLAKQVLSALYEFLRGFQAANAKAKGLLLDEVLEKEPDKVYRGLLTVLLRLVFLKFAEERGLLSRDELFLENYSLAGLYERLRQDRAQYPDTLDQRYGAWAQLLTLFRLTYDGGDHRSERNAFHLPPRHGYLFDPDRFPFLEGRVMGTHFRDASSIEVPWVSDAIVYEVLDRLFILNGERISYRGLDVEQIGSIYESMMGFSLHVADGPTVAIKSPKPHGAPMPVNLEMLLGQPRNKRKDWVQQATDQKLTGKAAQDLEAAQTLEDLVQALAKTIDEEATPGKRILPTGSLLLHPSLERRRSGSHYTPRSLTGRIVTKTLQPILQRLGTFPTPQQVLGLKVLDPAVGSGAFLVEACRQLAEVLVMAWRAHDQMPKVKDDEEPLNHARRLIAQHCLYGVDRNPMAVDLAKLSLWLVTLAADHPFTFLDHAIRHGDSLVGYHPEDFGVLLFGDNPSGDSFGVQRRIQASVEQAKGARRLIQEAPDDEAEETLQGYLDVFQDAVTDLELIGDALVHSFFMEEKAKARATRREQLWIRLQGCSSNQEIRETLSPLRQDLRALGVHPFHWPLEFPEVFFRENPGFDAIVGNPPFAGKNTIADGNVSAYLPWLLAIHPESHGNADLGAHFYRRSHDLIRNNGTFGLIASNTISQGDTRFSGLRWIRSRGSHIFAAYRRIPWPGVANVVTSMVFVNKGPWSGPVELDGRQVPVITAFLFHAGPDEDPARLEANAGKSFQGSIVLGMGFTFDDTDTKGVANSLLDKNRLVGQNPHNAERIFPYIGGEEVNSDPAHNHHRYVINFEDFPLGRRNLSPAWEEATERQRNAYRNSGWVPIDYPDAVAEDWPELLEILLAKVKGTRGSHSTAGWWQFERLRGELYFTINGLQRVLVCPVVSNNLNLTFLPNGMVYGHKLIVFAYASYSAFGLFQSGIHDVWTRFLTSTMKDDLNYSPSDCFETFPFPHQFETLDYLEAAGQACYEHRANLMVRTGLGMTKTYNRYHNPEEMHPEIVCLRELHQAMDEAVLSAYGWNLPLEYGFYPDFQLGEDESGEPAKVRLRYRWPNALREEVLGRLLDLNAQRAAEEAEIRRQRETLETKSVKTTTKRTRKPKQSMAAETPLPYLIDPGDVR
jgi:hypothetical protein